MDLKRDSNIVVPSNVVKCAWVAVNVANSNRDIESLQNPMNKVSLQQYSRPIPIAKPTKRNGRFFFFSELWKRFARTTTGHGFARMVDRDEPMSIRIFWMAVIVLLISGLLTSIILISYEALVVREIRREFIVQHNKTMFLPDIHICDTSLFNRVILQEMGFNTTMAPYLTLALSHMLPSRALIQDKGKQIRLETEFQRLMKGKTIHDVFIKAALKCENLILGCTHESVLYTSKNCCTKFFGNRRYVTDLAALCISTFHQPPLEELFDSQIYGFTVYLKTNVVDRFEFDSTIISSNVASRRGIMFAVSDSFTAVNPTISSAGHFTTLGTWTAVAVSLTRTDNTELKNGILSTHTCVSPNSPDHLHLVPNRNWYSQRNCVFSATQTVLEAKLNCSRFRFYRMGTLKPCLPDIMLGYVHSSEVAQEIKEKTNDCPEDCVSDNYHVSSSTSQLDLGDHDDMHQDEVHDNKIVHSAIHFFYPSFSFTIIKNHPESLFKWLSDVGGNMSLYLGASFVTLLEIFVLCFRCSRKCLLRIRTTM